MSDTPRYVEVVRLLDEPCKCRPLPEPPCARCEEIAGFVEDAECDLSAALAQLADEKLKRQQAEHERDCAVEDVARLRMALRNIKDEADIYDIDVTETNVRSRIGAIHGLSSAALAQRSEV